MRFLFRRRQLWLEERSQKETVGGRFDRANLAFGATGDYWKSSFHGGPFEVRVDFEVAEEFFGRGLFVFAVKGLQIRAGTQANFWNLTGEFRRVALAVGNRTGHRINDDVFRARIVFRAVGIGNVEDVAGKFDKSILKSTAGAEKG